MRRHTGLEVCLVSSDYDRYIVLRVSAAMCEYLLSHGLDVREAIVITDVVDQDVGGGVSQTVAAVVGPLLQR